MGGRRHEPSTPRALRDAAGLVVKNSAQARLGLRRELRLQALLGSLLVAVGVLVAAALLRTAEVPEREPLAIGFTPPRGAPPIPGRGFAIALHTELRNCERGSVHTLILGGSAEYWQDQNSRTFPRRARMTVALPANARDITTGFAANATDLVAPSDARRPNDLGRSSRVRSRVVGNRFGQTLVRVEVDDWMATLAPLRIGYRSRAVRALAVGRCWTRLPALSGDYGVLAGQVAAGYAVRGVQGVAPTGPSPIAVYSSESGAAGIYDPRLAATRGISTVASLGGSVDLGSSSPTPDRSVKGAPAWTCRSSSPGAEAQSARRPTPGAQAPDFLVPDAGGAAAGAPSLSAIDARAMGDCSAVVFATSSGSSSRRDLGLVLAGALLGGTTLIVEAALGLTGGTTRRRRLRLLLRGK